MANFGNGDPLPGRKVVFEALGAVSQHNRTAGYDFAVAAGARDCFDAYSEYPELSDDAVNEIYQEGLDRFRTEIEMSGSVTQVINADVLSRIGLEMVPREEIEEVDAPGSISLVLSSGQQFADFLDGLPAKKLNGRRRDLLRGVARNIICQVEEPAPGMSLDATDLIPVVQAYSRKGFMREPHNTGRHLQRIAYGAPEDFPGST